MCEANLRITVLLTLMGLASAGLAQTTMPPEGRTAPRATQTVKLSHNARQFANEYFEILETVSEVYSDYGGYFNAFDIPRLDKIQDGIEKTGHSIERGMFNSDPSGLKTNMEMLARLCAQFEKEAGHSAPERKALKLSRTLENDLEQLVFDLNDIIDEQDEFSKAENIAIGRYISDSLSNSGDIDIDKLSRKIEELTRLSAKLAGTATEKLLDSLSREMELAYREFEESKESADYSRTKRTKTYVIPDLPEIPPHPDMRGAPAPAHSPHPAIIGGHSVVVHGDDEVMVTSRLEDTLTRAKRQTPVKIISPYGNVIVNGVAGRTITASCEIMVAARTEKEARAASRQIHLSVTNVSGTSVVTLNIPGFDNPKTRLASSELRVDVPSECAVSIDSRFGATEVSEISGGVTIHGDHTQITVVKSGGTLTIDNAMGEIRVEGFRGTAALTNSHADIALDEIRGDVTARNSYAQTTIANSRGNLNFICKGLITVEMHRGNAVIENSTGATTIHKLVGDAQLKSSFGSVEMENIEGSVLLNSQNGSVLLSNVQGLCTIESKLGHVEASGLSGPLKLTNIDGSVKIGLADRLNEVSTVESLRGRITVGIVEDADIHVKAHATRGSIRGSDRLRVINRGTTSTAEGTWGAKSSTLTITGEDAAIQIEDN
jgi:hypothetical protein